MKPQVLLHLYRIRLRSRIGTELLALVGVALGVALVFAALIANASLNGAVRELNEGIVGRADLQLAARAADGFDRRVLGRVANIPGVAAAPVAEARVNLVGPGGRRSILLLGGDRRAHALGGRLLQSPELSAPTGSPGLFLPAPLGAELGVRPNGRVAVETGRGTAQVRVAGLLDRGEIGDLVESPVALGPLPLVQRLAGAPDRLNRILLEVRGARESEAEAALRRIVGERLNLGSASEEAAVFARASYPANRSTTLFSALSALVGFLFALNAVLLSLPQRRRLIADLRLAGYTPASVVEVAIFDALVLGVAASAVGLVLGETAARILFDSVPGYLSSAFAVGTQRIVTWQSAAMALAGGVGATCLAVALPLRDVLLANSGEEAAGPPAPTWQAWALAGGIALLGATLVIAANAPAHALLALGALLLSMLLLLTGWLEAAARAIAWFCGRLRSPVPILAALELQAGTSRIRTLALTGTGAIAVLATVAIGGARADLQRGLDGVAVNLSQGADVWIAFQGSTNIFATTAIQMPPGQLRAIERLPPVRSISRNRGSFLDVGRDRVWAMAPDPSRIGPVLRSRLEEGSAAAAARWLRRGGWVVLSGRLAAGRGVGVGDYVELPLPHPLRLRVAAVADNFGWPGGAIVLGPGDYARGWGSGATSSIGLELRRGASASAVVTAVHSVLNAQTPLRVETAAARTERQQASAEAGLARLGQISALVLISSALAMAASMAGLVWQRRPRFAALKVDGFGAGELWRSLLLETALLLLAGCLAGAAFGLAGQLVLDQALRAITGFPVSYEAAWPTALTLTPLLGLAALAILALPGWLAVRVQPAG